MLTEVLRSRMFLGGLLFFVLIVVGGVLYLKPVEREMAEDLAGTQEKMKPSHEDPAVQPPAPNGNPDVAKETLPLSFPELPSTALPPEDQAIIDALRAHDALVRPEYHADEQAIRDAYKELFAEQQKIHNDMLSDNADWAEIREARRKLKEKHRRARALIDDFRAKYAPSSQTEP